MSKPIFLAKSFGAVGDGVTDDGPALSHAFRAAAEAGGQLALDAGATYLVLSAQNRHAHFVTPFSAVGCKNFSVDGHGATVLCAPGISYLAIADCADFSFENIRFDCSETVYYVGWVTAVVGNTVTYETDTPVIGDVCGFGGVGFSIQYNEGTQHRPHRFFDEMRRLDGHHVEVDYHDGHGYRTGDVVFLPAMDIGHMYGEPFYLGGCQGTVLFDDVKILAAPSFTCAVKGNDADITFRSFDLIPSDRHGHRVTMTAWRDGFHCKDNRGALHWEGCEIGVLFDDVFNISATLGEVTEILSPDRIVVVNQEFLRHQKRMIPFDARVGDIIDLYDYDRDRYLGTAAVVDVLRDGDRTALTLSVPLEGITPGTSVGNHNTCAPHATVKRCRMTGTMRFRGPCTIEDTEMDLLQIWLMVEGDVEGPIPRDIVFRRCVLRGGGVEVRGYNRPANLLLPNIGRQICGIAFEDCTMMTTLECDVDVRVVTGADKL